MAKEVQVLVSVDRQHMDRVSEVARRCERAGMKVESAMEELGTLTGSIDASKLEDLERIEGVGAVEHPREIQLPTPDSEIQ